MVLRGQLRGRVSRRQVYDAPNAKSIRGFSILGLAKFCFAEKGFIFKANLDCANFLHICHKKYSVWALALKAIRL